MPPTSTALADEGAAIVAAKLVARGVLQEGEITRLLTRPDASGGDDGAAPSRPPRGTRCLADNLSDLRAQTAANARGAALVASLIEEAGRDVVLAYMDHIQANAEAAVRAMLREFARKTRERADAASRDAASSSSSPPASTSPSSVVVSAVDQMDDGTPIALTVTIDGETGGAVFDFEGTGPQVLGNTNAPPAVTRSAVVYALRCMVQSEIPLNQGCLAPVEIKIPPGSLLAPRADAAVVGGNVLTSQRVTDVVLRAFGAAAASQGCMNNFTFGDDGDEEEDGGNGDDGGSGDPSANPPPTPRAGLSYYETIAGGGGAGPGWHGAAGTQSHMTNTAITDPEILERRYPVVLHAFRLRPRSGGAGRWRGGDGVVREVEFLRPVTACILSERRATRPFGGAGGGDAAPGVNLLLRRGALDRPISLGGKAVVRVRGGDRIRILTPGGGGYGREEEEGGGGKDGGSVDRAALLRPPAAAPPPPRAAGSVHAYRAAQESA